MRRLFFLLLLLACAAPVSSQPAAGNGQPAFHTGDALPPAQAQALVTRALANEVQSAQDSSHPMRYQLRKTSPRLTTTKEIVETGDGDVARLVEIGGHALSPTDEAQESARLDALMADPSMQSHRKHQEDADAEMVFKLLRLLPQAFLYRYAGAAAGGAESFSFWPNPAFDPPDLETKALAAMSGEIFIDPAADRVTLLEGRLQQDTDYGWGVLGKLDKGGWVTIEQADVGGHNWRIVSLKMQMNLRLLFKTKNIDTVEEMSGYEPVPAGMDYREAIKLLRAGP